MRATNPQATFISLKPLYSFIRKHREDYEKALNLEEFLGTQYSKKCENLTQDIEEIQGIYVWGAFDSHKYWHSLYLGKAGLGKTKKLLRARITEELKDERCCLWRHVLSKAKLFHAGPRVHRGGKESWAKYIEKDWQRSIKKERATHIIWVPTSKLDNHKVRRVEAELIEALNPTANVQRPIPPQSGHRRGHERLPAFSANHPSHTWAQR